MPFKEIIAHKIWTKADVRIHSAKDSDANPKLKIVKKIPLFFGEIQRGFVRCFKVFGIRFWDVKILRFSLIGIRETVALRGVYVTDEGRFRHQNFGRRKPGNGTSVMDEIVGENVRGNHAKRNSKHKDFHLNTFRIFVEYWDSYPAICSIFRGQIITRKN